MINFPLFDLLRGAVDKVRKMNEANPKVKTADSSVFDNVIKNFQKSKDKPHVVTEEEYCDDVCEEIGSVQVENEADPNVETAEKSVFDDMKAEIEALKAQIQSQKTAQPEAQTQTQSGPVDFNPIPTPPPSFTPPPASEPAGVMAMTNSMGGSLGLRAEPDMGATVHTVRVPDQSLVKVLKYSENKIRLDGKDTRFALVQIGDQQGWLLESYLNFN
jgi:hypothetical protein